MMTSAPALHEYYRVEGHSRAEFVLSRSPEQGRFAVAARDFDAGSILLVETAFASAPGNIDDSNLAMCMKKRPHHSLFFKLILSSFVVVVVFYKACLWCSIPLTQPAPHPSCAECRLFFCTEACAQAAEQVHSALECGRVPTLRQLASRAVQLTPSLLLLAARVVTLLALSRPSVTADGAAGLPEVSQEAFLVRDEEGDSLSRSILSLEAHRAMTDELTLLSLQDAARMLLRF